MRGTLNIGASNDDASYRYKMPPLSTKIEGRGNGIKTVIVNMSDVAKALHVDTAYPTKFFGVELGAQSKYDKASDRAVVNGAHQTKDLQNLLGKFIDIFVLCPNCKLPETVMSVKKGTIRVDCAACGYNDALKTDHKLTTYILKNPPEASKKMAKVKDNLKSKDADDAVNAAKKNSAVEKVKGKKSKNDEDEIVWYTDISEEAQKARKAEELAAMGIVESIIKTSKDDGKDSSQGIKHLADSLKVFIAEKKELGAEITSEVRRIQLASSLTEHEKHSLVLEAVLDSSDPSGVTNRIRSSANVLKLFTSTPEAQRVFIGALEHFIGGENYKHFAARTALIFQAMYDEDVIEEELILEWYETPEMSFRVDSDVAKDIRSKASKFVEWLKTAEEEDEDEDEE
jgi:translation initiation factor 5